ncbi:hypothetical protein [Pantoea sp. App145]
MLREVDYTEQQLIESIGAITEILFANMVNRFKYTEIDYRPLKLL